MQSKAFGKYGKRIRLGLQGLFVAIILIVIAIVIGGVVYAYFNHLIQANEQYDQIELTGYQLAVPGGQTAYLQFGIQDTGQTQVENIQVYLAGVPVTGSCNGIPQSLTPGQSFSVVCEIQGNPVTSCTTTTTSIFDLTTTTTICTTANTPTIEAGEEFPLYVQATTTDGSTVSSPVINVVAQS